jgi:23S rRNA pseudouridine1911/1915/1917 synthase
MVFKWIADVSNQRVDVWIAEKGLDLSRTHIKKISQENGLRINGKFAKAGSKINLGDEIIIQIPDPKPLLVSAEDIPIEILYEDRDIIVVNKRRGMVVHPGAGNYEGTLVNALLSKYKDQLSTINGVVRPGIVHRIDKDTSGVLVVARNNHSHESLSSLFQTHDIRREYWALIEGVIEQEKGEINAPIGRHPVDRKKMAVNTKNGKNAVTHFKVLKRFQKETLVGITLETGRTHQIRVHMSHIGFPLVGDPVYGNKKSKHPLTGQLLHAKILGFKHPSTGEYMEFTTHLPEDFQKVLRDLDNAFSL